MSRWYSVIVILVAPYLSQAQLKTPPRMQVVPLPYDQVEFQRDGQPIARYHFGPNLKRPFLFPIIGPSGRCLTRMGHPHDPDGHSHHNSVWVAHNDVNGVGFWGDKSTGRIVHQKVVKLTDGDNEASVSTINAWVDDKTRTTLMIERRQLTVQPLEKGEWLLLIDLQFETNPARTAEDRPVVFGKTPFGLVAVRMAKSIGVNDGGGRILNSEGKINEKEVFWKQTRWVDYAGAITPKAVEGITLMDHPSNFNHPSAYHVRNDGWMGSSLTFAGPHKLEPGQPLRLRYGLYIHEGQQGVEALEARWNTFSRTAITNLTPVKKKTR